MALYECLPIQTIHQPFDRLCTVMVLSRIFSNIYLDSCDARLRGYTHVISNFQTWIWTSSILKIVEALDRQLT
jgi:hypothetical protein